MSLGTHTDTRIDNTHGGLKVCRLVPTAKSSNYKIIIKEHMINCLKQCVVNREMISNTPTTGTVVEQCMGVEGVKVMNEMIPEVGLDSTCSTATQLSPPRTTYAATVGPPLPQVVPHWLYHRTNHRSLRTDCAVADLASFIQDRDTLIEQSVNTLIEQSSNIHSSIGTFSLAAKDILQMKCM